jgi:hypothetical protein
LSTLDPCAWNTLDGFSTIAPMLFAFPQRVSTSSLVGHDDIGLSINPTDVVSGSMGLSTTVVIELADRDHPQDVLVPHWVEQDEFHDQFGGDGYAAGRPPLLLLQPARPLRHNAKIVVGVRGIRGVRVGHPVLGSPSTVFATVRGCGEGNGTSRKERAECATRRLGATVWPASRAAEFEEVVFPALARAQFGSRVPPAADHKASTYDTGQLLQLAWTFTTMSVESSLGVAKFVRDASLAQLPLADSAGASTMVPTVDLTQEHGCDSANDRIGRTVWGHFFAPNFLQTVGPGVNTYWNFGGRNKNGAGNGGRSSGTGQRSMPTQNGVERKDFVVPSHLRNMNMLVKTLD